VVVEGMVIARAAVLRLAKGSGEVSPFCISREPPSLVVEALLWF